MAFSLFLHIRNNTSALYIYNCFICFDDTLTIYILFDWVVVQILAPICPRPPSISLVVWQKFPGRGPNKLSFVFDDFTCFFVKSKKINNSFQN